MKKLILIAVALFALTVCDFPMFEMKCKNCFWWYKGHCTTGVCAAEETEPDFFCKNFKQKAREDNE